MINHSIATTQKHLPTQRKSLSMPRNSTSFAALFAATICMSSAQAHFPWITIDKDGKAVYFFGETPADRTYKLPPSVAKANVTVITQDNQLQTVEMSAVETDDFVGLKSSNIVAVNATLASKVTYGVYHGSRLDYYTQHCGGRLSEQRGTIATLGKTLDLHADFVDTEQGVDVFVQWQGKPLAGAKVTLFCDAGHEEGSAETDEQGKVFFNDNQVEDGLNAIMVGHTAPGDAGTLGDQSYGSVSHYLTATFLDPEDFTKLDSKPSASDTSVLVTPDRYPPIPETVTSFGAAIAGDALYVYGGHTGDAHQYHAKAQANTLRRIELKNPTSWQELGTGPGLQGLAMVAHNGKLIRIGGFTAKNDEGEDHQLWSQSDVAIYDPATEQWTDLPPMPQPRSSFDAVVLGDQVYVVGGWNMQGDAEAEWLQTAYSIDLSASSPQWQPLPEPPFQRRALSVAAIDNKIYAIGGMQSDGGPTTRVDVFDTKTQTWSRGPSLQGKGMDGFGSSSFATGGRLYVTTYSGALQRLANDGQSWEMLDQLERERFFHRLLPIAENQLVVVGGASMSSGKFEEIDVIEIQ